MGRTTVRRTYQAERPGFIFAMPLVGITGAGLDFSLARPMDSHPSVLAQKSSRRPNYPQSDVIVSIVGLVVVADGRAAVFGIIVEGTTAQHLVVPAPLLF